MRGIWRRWDKRERDWGKEKWNGNKRLYGEVRQKGVCGEGVKGGSGALEQEFSQEALIRELARLAFGAAGDEVWLAFLEPDRALRRMRRMDLSRLAELKRHGNGAVEVKLVDRLKAMELLAGLLGGERQDEQAGAKALYQALERRAGEDGAAEAVFQTTDQGADLVV